MSDPQRLVDDLVRGGWTIVGRGRGYTRLAWPTRLLHDRTLVVPSDKAAPEFDEMWQAVRGQLEDAVEVGVKAAHVLGGQVADYTARPATG